MSDEWHAGDEPESSDERPRPLTSRLTYEPFTPLSGAIRVDLGVRSHPGRRPVNEDHYLLIRMAREQETIATSIPDGEIPARFGEAGYGVAVADGIGAGGAGEVASRLAITTFEHLVLHFAGWNVRITPRTAEDVIDRADRFYRSIDERITDTARLRPPLAGMGTTLTAAYIADDALFLAHVGHSRAYLFRHDRLTQLTRDQTLAQRILETGRPMPSEAAAHDLRHILTDAIGGHGGVPHIQIEQYRLRHGDTVMVCTNGLTDIVDDQSCAAIVRDRRSADEQCQALLNLALERGALDNVTVAIAKYTVAK
jgi:serine/threonine protein phosphatase PrpC